jgi:hypothetical protein
MKNIPMINNLSFQISLPCFLFDCLLASQGQQSDSKVGHRKKWEAFQQEYNFGQDILGQ